MIKTDKNIRTSYHSYKQESETPVELNNYIELCNNYNKFIMDKVAEGNEVTLPYRLGTLEVIGRKTKIKIGEDGRPNLSPNWRKTKELWARCEECKEKKKVIYNTNEHTDGVKYKLLWSKKRVLIRNKTLYNLRLTRANKRRIYSEIMKGKEYFIKD